MLDLGLAIPNVADTGYMRSRLEVRLSKEARHAVKCLSASLLEAGATLNDGTAVKGNSQHAIAWLCERLSDAVNVSQPAVE